jgi:retron-type reverse transcriptase
VDVQGYFDAIPHDKLMKMVAERVSDGAVLGLVKKFLTAPIQEDGTLVRPKTGTPQGGTASPLLANVYLNLVDRLFQRHRQPAKLPDAELVRYADDMVTVIQT